MSQLGPPQDYTTCRSIEPGPPNDYRPVEPQRANQDGEDWHIGFWDCCSTGSLCCEAAACPCILAGRRHLRIKNTKATELTSTNGYCVGCFVFTIPLIPCYWVFTMATRREIRYRYGIRGSNRGDCMRSACCPYCALVQEEREILWREDQKNNAGDGGYGRRNDVMVYPQSQ
ncbi:PLAC8-domain-containing protein [Glonium stellatum]|uniref:PLAC8-domain-containing protein n=1 Tax=Glonium stellatum TaxID=574774 RepID=A0A8E2JL88_9PEZI|nr:PLAC8-domain-containing protein [Glonium stellatum]